MHCYIIIRKEERKNIIIRKKEERDQHVHCYIILRKEEWKKEKPACALLYNYKKGRMEERETSMCIVI